MWIYIDCLSMKKDRQAFVKVFLSDSFFDIKCRVINSSLYLFRLGKADDDEEEKKR